MDKNMQPQDQAKIQLSLAALMFFSPLVQNVIKKTNMELSENDKTFIRGYIRFGYIALIVLAITLITGMTSYRFELVIIDWIYSISIIALTIILVLGTIGILTNTNILGGKKELMSLYSEHVSANRKDLDPARGILLNYLPIYNIYQRYQSHNFDKPNLLLKESILAWGIFIALGLFTSPWRTSTFLILIIIRTASLMGGIDIISPQVKKFINALFLKNPEELRGYIRGSVAYLYNRFIKASQGESLTHNISSAKESFSLLYNVQLENSALIKTQYALAIIASMLLIRQTNRNLLERTKLIPLLILLGRYVVMLFKFHHLPPLPIFKEITDLGTYVYEKFKKHTNV